MTILTLVGAQRRKMPTGSGHYELTRQGGAGRGATRFMATRILHDQLLYYFIMVFSTGSTALIILFELVKGYSQVRLLPCCRLVDQALRLYLAHSSSLLY